jgi:hypothetical protein
VRCLLQGYSQAGNTRNLMLCHSFFGVGWGGGVLQVDTFIARRYSASVPHCCSLIVTVSNLPCPALSVLPSLVSLPPQGEADSALDIMWRKKVTDGQAA